MSLPQHADVRRRQVSKCGSGPRASSGIITLAFVLAAVCLCGIGVRRAWARTNAGIVQPQALAQSQSANGDSHAGQEQAKGAPVHPVHPQIVSKFSAVDVEPDGDLGKSLWSHAKRVRFDQAAFAQASYPEAATTVASRWTAKYLYLAFWCDYQSLNIYEGEDPGPERLQLWDRDVVEAFINPEPARTQHYYEFEVAPNNQWVDLEIDLTRQPFGNAQWNSGFQHATRVDAVHHVWTSEWRIPMSSLTQAVPHAHDEWRLNFYRCDGPGGDTARRQMSWGAMPEDSTQHTFHQPASFGVMRFAK